MPRMGGYVPTDHKTRHQTGGRDEISIASLAGNPANRGAASGLASLNVSSKVVEQPASISDFLEATPTDGLATKAPDSNWAYDHAADPDAHHATEIPEGRAKYGTTTALTIPGVFLRSISTVVITANIVYYYPIYIRTPITIDQVTIEVTAPGAAGTKLRFGIYAADVDWQPLALKVASGEIAIDAIAVVNTALTETTLAEGRYLLAVTADAGPTLRGNTYATIPFGVLPTLGASALITDAYVTKNYAALADPGTAWDTVANSASATFIYYTFLRVKTP